MTGWYSSRQKSGSVRFGSPHGPEMFISATALKRSGARSAASCAVQPPQSWPASAVRASPRASMVASRSVANCSFS